MEITLMYKRAIGLDVHQAKISACAVAEQADGTVTVAHQEFGAFKRDRRALARWAKERCPDMVVMESPGMSKTCLAARRMWLMPNGWPPWRGQICCAHRSFRPPTSGTGAARQRQKLGGMLASEKNRLHKWLADAGIRLNVLVSDIHGQAGCAMVKALIGGKSVNEVLNLAGRLRASREQWFDALQPEALSGPHVFVLKEVMTHIEELEARMIRFDQALIQGLDVWRPQRVLLQTIPGIDLMGAAMLLVEIGTDMNSFGSAEKLASWVGICPGNNESAGKRKSEKTRKDNAWVRRLLGEFAQAAARSRCALKDKFAALSIRKGHKKSIVALAHKTLRTLSPC